MSLTLPTGPLAARRPKTADFTLDGPEPLLFCHEFPRRVHAGFAGRTVLDTRAGRLLHETGRVPVLYLPEEDLAADLLEATDHRTHCPGKGVAFYWTVRADDRVAENAVWAYPDPVPGTRWLTWSTCGPPAGRCRYVATGRSWPRRPGRSAPTRGTSHYFSVDGLEDAAWCYPEPLEDAAKVPGRVCFLHDDLVVELG